MTGLEVLTAAGCWRVRSAGATVYYLDMDTWHLLRVPGEGSSTGPYDGLWVRLVAVENREGLSRVDVGQRHRYLTDPDPGAADYRWWLQRVVTSIEPVERADVPAGEVPAPDEGDVPFRCS